ncbi:MAG TPA: hypothetical protein VGX24_08395 [Pyrinomonadaceae bacterium]|jgi:hypothetical protein|nr:hypothetical protein [Pyrinomonadaceae bacterium]
MMRKVLAVSLMLVVAGVLAFAQEGEQAAQPSKLTGYLIDNLCAGEHAGDAEGMAETAQGHPTACALMPSCTAAGFSLVSDKKTYKLDEAGNKLALAVLKTTKATKGLQVEVEGTLDGDNFLRASKVSEVKAAK